MTGVAVQIGHGAATHAGLRGRANEDAYLAAAPVFVVADGMGGHEAGARASAAVIAQFQAFVGAASVSNTEVRDAITRARAAVGALASGQRAAGTTLTGVVLTRVGDAGYWLALNIGDSRTYRWARGRLEQISIDHSVVQELVDSGQMDAVTAARHVRRNEITRAIGAGSTGEADFWMLPAESGDRILVCSDGLSTELDDERIARILGEEHDPQKAATRLVHEALLAGGRDNVTVIVVDADGDGDDGDVYDTVPAGGRSSDDADIDTRPRAVAGGRA
ncbi:protein phosphatase 2C domain-containing protein [Microbacterium sp. NM3R9]|uniref:PP2C family protein-serine/threonine phosphatase n=1 Tax=Microbacterium thalli TaxID=3027921 RepID=UPI00236643FA|nr:protein phosphatase 2C domain-containing protein [Microbacterium thalli]MDD7928498.1 protein phosphatase 2C domain-containing protein [Microbacterium thalli]MDN8547930.1 protein phosphatase 2C domain-containing protein [Microbacterium thalli]